MASPASNVTDLERVKRRLIRNVAKLKNENVPEGKIWSTLKETHSNMDCQALWERMRALTLKKLMRLFLAEDCTQRVPPVARMTNTDWLMFDLVLVHESIDIMVTDLKEVPAILLHLVALVIKHKIESRPPELLVKAWLRLTIDYNVNGRNSSPMLLQRRWYLIKEGTRKSFYALWFSYCNNLNKADVVPCLLFAHVASKYPKLLITPFMEWEEMIKNKFVVLPEDLNKELNKQPRKETETVAGPDIQVMEQKIETIDLVDKELNKETNQNTESNSDSLAQITNSNGYELQSIHVEENMNDDDGKNNSEDELIIKKEPTNDTSVLIDPFNRELIELENNILDCDNVDCSYTENTTCEVVNYSENIDRNDDVDTDNNELEHVDNDIRIEDDNINNPSLADNLEINNENMEIADDIIHIEGNNNPCITDNLEINNENIDKNVDDDTRIESDTINMTTLADNLEIDNENVAKEDEHLKEEHINKSPEKFNDNNLSDIKIISVVHDANEASIISASKAPINLKTSNINVLSENIKNNITNVDETDIINQSIIAEDLGKLNPTTKNTESEINQNKNLVKNIMDELDSIAETDINFSLNKDTFDEINKNKHLIGNLENNVEECVEDIINETSEMSNDSKPKLEVPELNKNPLIDDPVVQENITDVERDDVIDIDDNCSDIEFVEDGIEFHENEFDFTVEESPTEKNYDEPAFDEKLIMLPIVYTTKLESMNTLKNTNIQNTVNLYDIIDNILMESKPIHAQYKNIFNLKTEPVESNNAFSGNVNNTNIATIKIENAEDLNRINLNADEINRSIILENHNLDVNTCVKVENQSYETEIDASSDIDEDVNRFDMNSVFLQKPVGCKYNPIMLCKNPDFNTRLKRLPIGFISIPNNYLMLKACKPLTIDLYKGFDQKLVNGVLYLKNCCSGSRIQRPTSSKATSTKSTVLPSALPAQSLVDNVTVNIEDFVHMQSSKPVEDTQCYQQSNSFEFPIVVRDIQHSNAPNSHKTPLIMDDIKDKTVTSLENLSSESIDKTTIVTQNVALNEEILHKPQQENEITIHTNNNINSLSNNAQKTDKRKNYVRKAVEVPWFTRPPLYVKKFNDSVLLAPDSVDKMLKHLKKVYVKDTFLFLFDNNLDPIIPYHAISSTEKETIIIEDTNVSKPEENARKNSVSTPPAETKVPNKTISTKIIYKPKERIKRRPRTSKLHPETIETILDKQRHRRKFCCWVKRKLVYHVIFMLKATSSMRINLPNHPCLIDDCTCCCKDYNEDTMNKIIKAFIKDHANNEPDKIRKLNFNKLRFHKLIEKINPNEKDIPNEKNTNFNGDSIVLSDGEEDNSTQENSLVAKKDHMNSPFSIVTANKKVSTPYIEINPLQSSTSRQISSSESKNEDDMDNQLPIFIKIPNFDLPEGVHLVSLPNRKVFAVVEPGITELDPEIIEEIEENIAKIESDFKTKKDLQKKLTNNRVIENITDTIELSDDEDINLQLNNITNGEKKVIYLSSDRHKSNTDLGHFVSKIFTNAPNFEKSEKVNFMQGKKISLPLKKNKVVSTPVVTKLPNVDLPKGVHLVLLPDGKVNAVFEPGISNLDGEAFKKIFEIVSNTQAVVYKNPSFYNANAELSGKQHVKNNIKTHFDKRIRNDSLKLNSTINANDQLVNKNTQVFLIRPHKNKKKPIFLGKNKILLTTSNLSSCNEKECSSDKQDTLETNLDFELPEGVNLMILPNNKVEAVIKPGLLLSDDVLNNIYKHAEFIQNEICNNKDLLIKAYDGQIDNQNGTLNKIESHIKSIGNPMLVELLEKNINKEFLNMQDKDIPEVYTVENSNSQDENILNSEQIDINNTPNLDKAKNHTIELEDTDCSKDSELQFEPPNKSKSEENMNNFVSNNFTNSANTLASSELDDVIDSNIVSCVSSINAEPSEITELENKSTNSINENEKLHNSINTKKKSILSDLMEMSGIFLDDTENLTNANDSCYTNEVDTNTNISQTCSENITNSLKKHNTLPNNTGQTAEKQNILELSPITSIAELKIASQSNGKFFSLNFDTGQVFSVRIEINKNRNASSAKVVEGVIEINDSDDDSPIKHRKTRKTVNILKHKRFKENLFYRRIEPESVPVKPVKYTYKNTKRKSPIVGLDSLTFDDSDDEPLIKVKRTLHSEGETTNENIDQISDTIVQENVESNQQSIEYMIQDLVEETTLNQSIESQQINDIQEANDEDIPMECEYIEDEDDSDMILGL